jgi:hypothetical protein
VFRASLVTGRSGKLRSFGKIILGEVPGGERPKLPGVCNLFKEKSLGKLLSNVFT